MPEYGKIAKNLAGDKKQIRQLPKITLIFTLEGILRYREVEDEVNGTTVKHRIAEHEAALES